MPEILLNLLATIDVLLRQVLPDHLLGNKLDFLLFRALQRVALDERFLILEHDRVAAESEVDLELRILEVASQIFWLLHSVPHSDLRVDFQQNLNSILDNI